jgi:DNA replication and repair protein RecF
VRSVLSRLYLTNFRCFDSLDLALSPGFQFFIGANGEGKTSLLEAACALLRLQSQRSATLAPLIRFGAHSFGLAGTASTHHLQFRYSRLRRRLLLNEVEQRTAEDYLRVSRVVSFANADIELARGTSEARRRYLDFIGAQIDPRYRPTLRAYERALRSRNALLKSPGRRSREIAAYDAPLLGQGAQLSEMRRSIAAQIAPLAAEAHALISGSSESLGLEFAPGNAPDFAAHLASSRSEEARLRQTVVGPHRDDIELLVNGRAAQQFASEGQQRTLALALKIAQAQIFAFRNAAPPLLLIDDIFGELDPERRGRLLGALPAASQKLVTATVLPKGAEGAVFELRDRRLVLVR